MSTNAQQVVIVNGSPEILATLDPVLDGGHYDVVFVESSERAYSQIKRVQPNMVILCVRIDDADGEHEALRRLRRQRRVRSAARSTIPCWNSRAWSTPRFRSMIFHRSHRSLQTR